MEQTTKALVASKTFQIAILQAVLAAIVIFDTQYPGVGVLVMVKSALDIVLRLYTTQPIGGIISDQPGIMQ